MYLQLDVVLYEVATVPGSDKSRLALRVSVQLEVGAINGIVKYLCDYRMRVGEGGDGAK